MNYDAFEAHWLGKRDDYDGVYRYQCVDLIKRYLDQCYGIKPGAWGNAIDYWTNTRPEILAKFDRIKTTDVKRGDIVVIDVPTNTNIEHIGIATGYTTPYYYEVLEQNGVGGGDGLNGNAIRKYTRSKSKIIGVLRPKEEDMTVKTQDEAAEIVRGVFKREPSAGEINDMMGRYWKERIVYLRTSKAGATVQAKVDGYDRLANENKVLQARIAELEKQLAASSGTYEPVTEQLYRKK